MTNLTVHEDDGDDQVRAELHHALLADPNRLGEIYRCIHVRGLSDAEIQRELDLATVGTIGHSKRSIRAICDGWNPPGLGPASRARSELGRLLRDFNFSEPVRETLRRRYEDLESNVQRIMDQRLEAPNIEHRESETTPVDAVVAGVYIWTINTYLESEDDRHQVWFRIGCSEDVLQRMRQHRSDVKLPEPLLLARVYSSERFNPKQLESKFHEICTAAVQERAKVNNRDREWFRTNLEFLDRYALDIGCTSHENLVDEEL